MKCVGTAPLLLLCSGDVCPQLLLAIDRHWGCLHSLLVLQTVGSVFLVVFGIQDVLTEARSLMAEWPSVVRMQWQDAVPGCSARMR